MRNKSRFEILALVQAMNLGVNVAKVSIMPGGATVTLSEWVNMLNNCDEGGNPYQPGAHVTFHFEDTTFVHLKF